VQRRHAVIALAALSAPAVHAHERKPHAKKAGAVVKEQKDWGIAGDAAAARRTVVVRMTDQMRFTPDLIDVKLNEVVRFDIRNDGRMLHEMVIGTARELEDHAALMLKFPDMEHDEPYMAHVAAGQRGRIVWTFNRAGEFEFACLIAGHYQAGMKGRILVKG
jgi:uncharacterized cupredoxin-like copper-binding protein